METVVGNALVVVLAINTGQTSESNQDVEIFDNAVYLDQVAVVYEPFYAVTVQKSSQANVVVV